MKNLLTYINPSKGFNDCDTLVKVQIDNSFSLGWKKEDILLVTNFPYEYNGVKSIIVNDEHFCAVRPRSNKTTIIPYLLNLGIIGKEICWVHDFDAYQSEVIEESELGLDNVDAGFTDYGWRPRWCLGSYFFKESSKDIFERLKNRIFENVEDETALMELTENDVDGINARIKRLDITYNLGMRRIANNYGKAEKPLKVLHFHPVYKGVKLLDNFMYGKNDLGFPLMTERLADIFKYHGIQ